MKAMILAAGKGLRLKPLTDARPKALIEVGGVALLEIVIKRLIAAGVDRVIINTCHLANLVEKFIAARESFGIRVEVSRESELLDTGGGLKKAAAFFDDGKPFFLHNADVLSGIDLQAMLRAHGESGALATLAVQDRAGDRRLLFDGSGCLRGRASGESGEGLSPLAFCGIHVISPKIFPRMTESGIFSIIDAYLRLAGSGEKIMAYRADGCDWQDIGSLEKLNEARRGAGS